ncbi:hypothetical protein SISNIDRAFT_488774 [Sistotremastrum niveocremeum HHB9708]|uniref:Uncharacterized protein n=1 Tax=Sistotremastrum niveocremeum HHB9708 TaxID=1314777 RepID=A0A164QS13_9AGAM|nr:hypothetical protein SISNIDRAFT_488774 [Sistotremastrum niveocremeum HHB9708]
MSNYFVFSFGLASPPSSPMALNARTTLLYSTDVLFQFLPFRELMILSSFSINLKHRIQIFLLTRFRTTFNNFIGDFDNFRTFWRTQNILLSGSAVLHFISQDTNWYPHDLDFIVGRGNSDPLLEQLRVRGFTAYRKLFNKGPFFAATQYLLSHNIYAVHRLTHTDAGHVPQTFDIIESTLSDPIETLIFFHSTQVMNFMTADALTILYPDLTLEHMGIVRDDDRDITHLVQKYEERGFEIFYSASDFKTTYSACPLLLRCVGDNQTLYYEFQGTSSNEHGLHYPTMLPHIWHFWQLLECSYPFCRNCSFRNMKALMDRDHSPFEAPACSNISNSVFHDLHPPPAFHASSKTMLSTTASCPSFTSTIACVSQHTILL